MPLGYKGARVSDETAFAREVREGLSKQPKAIPAKWIYDERGSKLFEEITELPEYYLTDRERAIFQTHANAIAACCPSRTALVELGAGSAEKTRLLLEALVHQQGPTIFRPIDISSKALEMARTRFQEDEGIEVHPLQAGFVDGLAELSETSSEARLIAFIGSSIGNMSFSAQKELLARIRETMDPEDRFLLGTDMRKDEETMVQAYDDTRGVTATFTLNVLRRINRELGGRFDLDAFEHEVAFDEEKSAIVTHLVSLRDQSVPIDALEATFDFAEGERVHIEDAYKYTESMIDELVDHAGLVRSESWYDDEGAFGVHMLQAQET